MAAPISTDHGRRRAPDERPQQILTAALEVFGEQGLAGARLDDIARRAGIAKGTIYLYFPNKEELFREVIRRTLGDRLKDATAAIAAVAADQPARPLLRRFMEEWWAFLCTVEYQTVYRLVIGELHRFPELLGFYAEEAVLPSRRLLSTLVERGTRAGEFRAVDPQVAARAMASMFISHSLWVGQQQVCPALGGCEPDRIFEQLFDFALHALQPAGDHAAPTADAPNA